MQISIVIPVLNEAAIIAETISRARATRPCEIIVVDGGSTDSTHEAARHADLVLISKTPGRAVQQNLGAELSRGDVLLFLHADCWLEADSLAKVVSSFEDERVVGGCFRQRIDAEGRLYRGLEWGNVRRVKWWGLAYGDQGIFVRRTVFERLGGFPNLGLMEDLFFMKRLRREGRLALLDGPLHVSARRWQQTGIIRQTARNWFLTTLAQLGMSPTKLAKFYPHVR